MKKLLALSVLLLVVAFNGTAFGWGTTGGDGSDYGQLQETAVFFNNSGGVLQTGTVVILDLSGTGVTTGGTLGAYVTTTTTADNRRVMGVVKIVASDQSAVVVITRGPADVLVDGHGDGSGSPGDAVGTSTKAGYANAGSRLGMYMESPSGSGYYHRWIWVDPHNSE